MINEETPFELRDYFAGIAEYTFEARLGVADPPLIDYLTDLLVRFVRCDSLHRVRDTRGKPLGEVAGMLAEANHRIGDARRDIHRHIGDYTLFWNGVYPEALRRLRSPVSMDSLIDYTAQGKRAYYIASTIPASDDPVPNEVLHRLSERYDLCVYGLGEVRREWERSDDAPESPGPFLIN